VHDRLPPHTRICALQQRWGRGQEVPSEDPTLSSKYATQFVRGMQEGALYPKYLKTIATCKHFR
jgi:beta-glucosidase-like glycosyl hydrolase